MKRKTLLQLAPEAARILDSLSQDGEVRKMRRYRQHGDVSTFDHCRNVAELSVRINRRFHLRADEAALARGAMLHDFYLYDWHTPDPSHRLHGFRHPERAAQNAIRRFDVGETEQRIIRSHMWPLTLTKPPQCREAWIVCLADKCCAVTETLFRGRRVK